MMGATLFLLRSARALPSPRGLDVAAFGLLAGAALGVRSLGLLLFVYLALAIIIYLPWRDRGPARAHFAMRSALRMFPALALAYIIMILAWPWAALSPLNPIRGLFAFSEFHYSIRTLFAGRIYQMGNVPRLYIPGYVLIRVPLITLAGASLAVMSLVPAAVGTRWGAAVARYRDRVACRDRAARPARWPFTDRLSPECVISCSCFPRSRRWPASVSVSVLDRARIATAPARICRGRRIDLGCFLWEGTILVRLHPYESLSYNALVGGFRAHSAATTWITGSTACPRRSISWRPICAPRNRSDQPAAENLFGRGLRGTFVLRSDRHPAAIAMGFQVRVERLRVLHRDDAHELRSRSRWRVVATVERFGVPIAYVKDSRAIVGRAAPSLASAPP